MSAPARHGPAARSLLRVLAMAAKEAVHIRRDPRTLVLALLMPVVMLVLFGYGVSTDMDRLPLAVADRDQSEASRSLARALHASGEFQVVTRRGPEQAEALFRDGAALAVLVVPRGYQVDLLQGRRTPVQLLVDGSDPVAANQVLTKADGIVRAESRRLAGPDAARLQLPIEARTWTRYNPEGRSAYFMVPGLAAYLLAITAVMLTALAIAGEWERGSMEQLFASPVGRLEIVLGKLLPYLALGMLSLLLVLAFGAVAFGVPIVGSLWLVFLLGLVFLVGMLGQGLFISVVSKSQMVATQAGALSAMLPAIILSGMIFPVENMPLPLQFVSRLIPARYLVHGLRGVLLKGNGLDVLWPDLVSMAIFAVVIIALATRKFERRLA
ncbi:MAG: ABC transporter permease [Anaeromyxobacteraceae bacterium]|nr:ABC transporter permease [Anaeromyxobacteraceae bacterium]